MFRADGVYDRPAKRIVIARGATAPTEHHYLTPRLKSCRLPVATWDIGAADAPPPLDDAFVIVVRYLDGPALRHLRNAASRLAGVAWLVDDDIPAAIRESALPPAYRWRLAKFWLRYGRAVGRLASEVWFASDVLRDTYGRGPDDPKFQRIDPLDGEFGPGADRPARRPGEPAVIFYHAQITHLGECLWLRDVIAAAQARLPDAVAEIIGGPRVRQAFRDIPRCRVLHPMSWSTYRSYIDTARGEIGLAPLRDTAFNRARSYVKYLDIVRYGGVGIFADAPPYAGVVRSGENGVLLPMEPDRWADEIVRLATDGAAWTAMREKALTLPEARTPCSLSRLLSADS